MTYTSGLLIAIGASVLFGISAVLQRAGAAYPERFAGGADPRRRAHAARAAFAVGVGLDGVGLAASLVAVRELPIHLVEAILASSVAIATVGSAVFLREGLARSRWLLVAMMTVAMIGVAGSGSSADASGVHGPAMLVPPLVLIIVAGLALRFPAGQRRWPTLVTGALSGTAFGMVTLSGRLLPSQGTPLELAHLAVGATIAGGAVLGLVLFWSGVRQGTATAVVAGQTLAEALVPSVLALAMGERWSGGTPALTGLGFAVAVACALALAAPGAGDTPPGRDTERDQRPDEVGLALG